MKSFRLISAVLCIIHETTASHSPTATTILERSPTVDFHSFGRSLGMPESAVLSIGRQYAKATSPAEKAQAACRTAQISLGEDKVDTQLNQTLIGENWSATCILQPACVVRANDAVDVSAVLRISGFYQSKFSVRSGGHSPNPGWSSVGPDGILLILDAIDKISLSEDKTNATIGAGARWRAVYDTLDADKAVVLGARHPQVGVGGYFVGGGYSLFSNQFGLAVDKVKNFEVVLGNGTIVDANAEENVSLFWALKGGGLNFGVVTYYDVYTVPIYDIWAKMFIFSPDQALEILEAHDQWQKNASSDGKSSVILWMGLDTITLGFLYSEPTNEIPAVFAPFLKLEPLSVVLGPMNTTIAAFGHWVDSSFSNTKLRHDYRGCSSRIDTELTKQVYSFWREKALAVHNATGANQTFILQHIGTSFNRQGSESEGNALNIPPGEQQWWTTLADWANEEDDELVRSVSIDTCNQWETIGKERGSDLSIIYMNDASRDQNPLASYGSENLERLKEISRVYDEDLVFQNLQNSGFLLSKT